MKVYISGPHAVGKTSTCEELTRRHPNWWRTEYDDERLKPQDHYNLFGFDDLYRRQLWRCLVYGKDELRFHMLSKQYPILIIDRHPIENLIYTETFYHLGWLQKVDFKKLEKIWSTLFSEIEHPDILLMPKLEWQKEKILRPKNSNDRQIYREDDWNYLSTLRQRYERRKWALVIRTCNLNERVETIEQYVAKKSRRVPTAEP